MKTVGGVHGDAADSVLSDVLLNFYDDGLAISSLNGQSLIDGRKVFFIFGSAEMNVHDRADDLGNMSC